MSCSFLVFLCDGDKLIVCFVVQRIFCLISRKSEQISICSYDENFHVMRLLHIILFFIKVNY